MDRTPENNPSSENPSQKELDLGINQIEPVTPKKVYTSETSIFDKAKGGFKGIFAKKENLSPNQFAVRKEPTFGEPSSMNPATSNIKVEKAIEETMVKVENSSTSIGNEPNTTAHEIKSEFIASTETLKPNVEPIRTEPNTEIPKAQSTLSEASTNQPQHLSDNTEKAKIKNPEDWKVMQKLPRKHRRLVIAIAVALLALLALLWLKPSSDTVQDFQTGGNNNLPIEFQPLDQNQPVENADANNVVTTQDGTAPVDASQAATPAPETTNAPQMPTTQSTPIASQITAEPVKPVTTEAPKAIEKVKPQEQVKTKPVEKPKTAEVTKVKPTEKTKVVEQVKAKSAEKPQNSATNKPMVTEAKPATTNSASTKITQSTSQKTLTIPQGTSLMQVFRDNNLNISDVNAMTKANGANGALSGFKPGDKVQVSLNPQGRVSTMRLSNGATFTRQADGTYQYKK
ncbi:opacity-associated protein OapA [Mannheimia massilioguelmaensis]|uniref:opacity-associated protein OapA n=1 Tax=Mannheimia massilioguelmaensis TaxID=1604354 RepID=UPI0005C9D907|nr:opacity-associated protein OapA [Mannheimia massilioguelmaensis]